MSIATLQRRDLHNASIDGTAATQGLCGFIHLPTGRVCRMRHRHSGSCDLRFRRAGGPQLRPASAGSDR